MAGPPHPDRPPLLAIRDAVLHYRRRIALDGVGLTLRGGETMALLGPNGAGKTSLLRLAAGRRAPERGTVRVAGDDPATSRTARRLIGFVPQEIALYPRLSVLENVDVFAQLAGLGRADRRAAVPEVLRRTAIEDVAQRVVGTLSGGYQRRVNIAASLVTRPRLVLLDEPTQGVDLAARAAIHALLDRLRAEGAAILLSTHDFSEAERVADRVAVLSAGRIVREGRLAELLPPLTLGPPEHDVLLDASPGPAAVTALRQAGFVQGETGDTLWHAGRGASDGLDGAALLCALRDAGVPVAEIRVRRRGLDALYRDALAPRPARQLELVP